jgi:hypothetical protein
MTIVPRGLLSSLIFSSFFSAQELFVWFWGWRKVVVPWVVLLLWGVVCLCILGLVLCSLVGWLLFFFLFAFPSLVYFEFGSSTSPDSLLLPPSPICLYLSLDFLSLLIFFLLYFNLSKI